MDRTAPPGTPSHLARAYRGFEWELAHRNEAHSVVYRLYRGGDLDRYLKLAPAGAYPGLAGEADRLGWAGGYLPVPEVIEQGSEGSVDWLVTVPLPGQDGTHPDQLSDPERLTGILARGLRHFHDTAPVDRCPFDFRLTAALTHVRARLSRGLVDRERDFHPEFADLGPDEALAVLESTTPTTEDPVVCHGDYCPPNILIRHGGAVGYLDLGELGVADRWWDLAVATWSLTWNVGPGFEERFLAEYGVDPDPERTRFYRLLYDLAS